MRAVRWQTLPNCCGGHGRASRTQEQTNLNFDAGKGIIWIEMHILYMMRGGWCREQEAKDEIAFKKPMRLQAVVKELTSQVRQLRRRCGEEEENG